MKILYLAYENAFSTGILQAQVITQMKLMNKKFGVKYILSSTVKNSEKSSTLYINNKKEFDDCIEFIDLHEFDKTVENTQSVFSFIRDISKIIISLLISGRKNSVDIIHARSYGGGCIALVLSKLLRKPFIFDMRGILPEETVQVGKISNTSYKFKLLKLIEKVLIRESSMVFTVSNSFSKYIVNNFDIELEKVFNISNPTLYSSYKHDRKPSGVVNFLYSGSCQDWHCSRETLTLFRKLVQEFGNKVFLNICTADVEEFKSLANSLNLPIANYSIQKVPFSLMPEVYKKSHVGFCFRREGITTEVSCPVKFAEYLASGMTVISNSGVSDFDELFKSDHRIGLLIDYAQPDIKKVADVVSNILASDGYVRPIDNPKFNWDDVSDEVMGIYKCLVK